MRGCPNLATIVARGSERVNMSYKACCIHIDQANGFVGTNDSLNWETSLMRDCYPTTNSIANIAYSL